MSVPPIRKRAAALIAGLLVLGAVSASASTLGGVSADSLGADAAVVGSCDSDGVTVDFTTELLLGLYVVDLVQIGGIAAACSGLTYEVALLGAGGTSLVSTSGTVGGTSMTLDLALLGLLQPSAALVTGVAITIHG